MKHKVNELKKTTGKHITKGIQKTRELKFYLLKFAFRVAIFLGVLYLYVTERDLIGSLMTKPFWHEFTLIHLIWFVFMGLMIMHLIPNNRLSMAWKKAKETEYRSVEHYDELELMRFIQKQNIAAWKVMLVWLCFNAVLQLESVLYFLSGFNTLGDSLC